METRRIDVTKGDWIKRNDHIYHSNKRRAHYCVTCSLYMKSPNIVGTHADFHNVILPASRKTSSNNQLALQQKLESPLQSGSEIKGITEHTHLRITGYEPPKPQYSQVDNQRELSEYIDEVGRKISEDVLSLAEEMERNGEPDDAIDRFLRRNREVKFANQRIKERKERLDKEKQEANLLSALIIMNSIEAKAEERRKKSMESKLLTLIDHWFG